MPRLSIIILFALALMECSCSDDSNSVYKLTSNHACDNLFPENEGRFYYDTVKKDIVMCTSSNWNCPKTSYYLKTNNHVSLSDQRGECVKQCNDQDYACALQHVRLILASTEIPATSNYWAQENSKQVITSKDFSLIPSNGCAIRGRYRGVDYTIPLDDDGVVYASFDANLATGLNLNYVRGIDQWGYIIKLVLKYQQKECLEPIVSLKNKLDVYYRYLAIKQYEEKQAKKQAILNHLTR